MVGERARAFGGVIMRARAKWGLGAGRGLSEDRQFSAL